MKGPRGSNSCDDDYHNSWGTYLTVQHQYLDLSRAVVFGLLSCRTAGAGAGAVAVGVSHACVVPATMITRLCECERGSLTRSELRP